MGLGARGCPELHSRIIVCRVRQVANRAFSMPQILLGSNSIHGRDEADVVLTPGLSLEETDAGLRDGHHKSMWSIPLSVTDFLCPVTQPLGAQIITKE